MPRCNEKPFRQRREYDKLNERFRSHGNRYVRLCSLVVATTFACSESIFKIM